MKKLISEFKDFAMKGNIVDLAVAFVLGAAFAAVVKSLVDNVLMPVIAAIFGQPDFSNLSIDIGESDIVYGAFVNEVVAFVLVALALFLFVVKPYQAVQARKQAEEPAEEPAADPEDVVLLRQIRDALVTR